MASNNNIKTRKRYIIGLLIAIILLSIASTIAYRQVKNLENSASQVSKSLMVDKEINSLFANYSLIKSTQMDYAVSKKDLSLFLLKNYEEQSEETLQGLKELTLDDEEQQKNIAQMITLKSQLNGHLEHIIRNRSDSLNFDQIVSNRMDEITYLLNQISSVKDKMMARAQGDLKLKKDAYRTNTYKTPITILGIAIISLIVFAIAFWKIVIDRSEIERTKGFLEHILQSVTNVITHLEPVRDESNTIVDYRILFSNKASQSITGKSPSEIQGTLISKTYPVLFTDGMFEKFNECIENNEILQMEREYDFLGPSVILKSTLIKLNDGVVVTSEDVTAERIAAKKLEIYNRQLAIKNDALNAAEIKAGLGSFRYDSETEDAQTSDNYFRLLGLQPNEIDINRKSFTSFIHPDDVEEFDNWMEQMLLNKEGKEHVFRINSKDGIQKTLNFKLNHSIEKGREVLIGIAQDISVEIERKAELEDQNLELKRSNEELNSFNHVVSHDLQEPLRKIQLFISLIKEEGQIAGKHVIYFEKIEKAAQRMQTLIKHLLTYSSIGKSDRVQKQVDLNETLQNVVANQSELIEEKQMTITIQPLPSVFAISFQMEQLFNNLISNALKYSKPGVSSKILIASEVVHRSQIHEDFRKRHQSYHRISVIDNGTGFQQEHADRIFDLFQRLHQSDAYSGTGIGLAICKKIMENHNGHIAAVGVENEGATFIVHLPVEREV